MGKKLIVANWKMNLSINEASLLLHRLQERIRIHKDTEVALAPNYLCLQPLSLQIDHRKFKLAAQNAYFKDEGAFTGEVSFNMMRGLVDYVIIGHSERRLHFGESLETIRSKVAACVRNGITPILCVGETKQERRAGETKQVIHDQLTTALSNLTASEISNAVIAYEPVWAISTFEGEIAKPDQVKREMDFIRHQVAELYGKKVSQDVKVLYGGSVDEHIAGGYLALEGCDGALIGGASLNYHKFSEIVETAHKLAQGKDEDGEQQS